MLCKPLLIQGHAGSERAGDRLGNKLLSNVALPAEYLGRL
jgi:hypothetical protein